ncbi:twin-arginine translocation signal domain-containing protein [Rhodospirillaceae bacterium SYSU D60014]|uniref:twin-arginine translocation signal domain-containing protein n=1 Tax=Virgifigura deserti TaxID=2268457 RepID=UPI000E673F26
MKKDKDLQSTPRRDFLKLAGLGTVAGAAAVAGAPEAAEAAAPEEAKPGYQETEHVKRFYSLARF